MRPSTLTYLFRSSLAAHAGHEAVRDDRGALTYAELDAASNGVARALIERGVGLAESVGIFMDRGIPLVATMLGIVKAGATYLAIDTGYPGGRRDLMIKGGRVRLVVSDSRHEDQLGGAQVVVWERDCAVPDGRSEAIERPVWPMSPACVLYTSGSTGEPKGIVLEHRSLVALATNERLPRLTPDDRVGQISSPSFDGITLEVWAALAAGAGIVVLPDIVSTLAADLRRTLRKQGVTAMLVPATVLNHVVSVDRDAFSPLRHLCSGGDVLQPATCRALLGGPFQGAMYNLYGPTEITTAATIHRVGREDGSAASVPLGSALKGYEVHVLEANLRPVPSGEGGEIHIGGAGLATGYLRRPDLTAARFLPDPFGAAGGRLYATGDLGRSTPDGELEYLGRFDHQVKIRGHRIEPSEIERAICRHPEVHQAAVVAEETDGGRQVVAFVVPVADTAFTADVRAFLSDSLPSYMLPAAVVVVRSMPTTSNGKRDLEALMKVRHSRLQQRARYVPPDTDTESWLASLWERQLNTESIGAMDDFFELGGHSLLALRIRSLVQRSFGVQLPFRVTFEHSTVRSLARLIDELRGRDEARTR
jgi:amino acid adenylation domain-containing protein